MGWFDKAIGLLNFNVSTLDAAPVQAAAMSNEALGAQVVQLARTSAPTEQELPPVPVSDLIGRGQLQEVADKLPGHASLAGVGTTFKTGDVRALTPARLVGLLHAAEGGDWQSMMEMFAKMEATDPHIHAEMAKRRRAILTLPWMMQPPDDASAQEEAACEWLNALLQRMPDFEDVLLGCMDAVGHGFSAQEIGWEVVTGVRPDGTRGVYHAPGTISWRPQSLFMPERLALLPGDHTNVRLRDMTPDGQALWPDAWLVHVHRARFAALGEVGLYRTLAWAYLFKHYALTDCAEFLEIYGLPMRLGTYPSSASAGDKRTLLRALVALGHDAAAIVPEGMMVEFKEAVKNGGDAFLPFAEYMDRAISKAILGQTLSSQSGDKGGGSFALGKVHADVQRDILISDARQVASTINRALIEPLLRLNLPGFDAQRMPRFVFETAAPEDLGLLATTLPRLAAAGMRIGVDYAHERLQIPKAEAGEEVLQGSAMVGVAPGGQVEPDATALDAAPDALSRKKRGASFTTLLAQERQLSSAEELAAQMQLHGADAWQATLAKVQAVVNNASSLEALRNDLLRVYGSLEPAQLTKVMEAGFAVAQLRGMDEVTEETKA